MTSIHPSKVAWRRIIENLDWALLKLIVALTENLATVTVSYKMKINMEKQRRQI